SFSSGQQDGLHDVSVAEDLGPRRDDDQSIRGGQAPDQGGGGPTHQAHRARGQQPGPAELGQARRGGLVGLELHGQAQTGALGRPAGGRGDRVAGQQGGGGAGGEG